MASAPELENRPVPPGEGAPISSATEPLVAREEAPSVSSSVAGVITPVVQPQPQAVVDTDGSELLTPSEPANVEVHIPYTPERLGEMKKEPVEKSERWLTILWKRIWDHALFLGRKIVFRSA